MLLSAKSTPDSIRPAHLAAIRRAFPKFRRKTGYYETAMRDGQSIRTESAWDGGSRDTWVIVTRDGQCVPLGTWHSMFGNPNPSGDGWLRGERYHLMTRGALLLRGSIFRGKFTSVTVYYVGDADA